MFSFCLGLECLSPVVLYLVLTHHIGHCYGVGLRDRLRVAVLERGQRQSWEAGPLATVMELDHVTA